MGFDRLALWNEESSGIGRLDLYGSSDNLTFTALATGLSPTDNPGGNYLADGFSVNGAGLRYLRLDMSLCPQPNPALAQACAIGEVAVRRLDAAPAAVPEPGALALSGIGLLGFFAARRRRQRN